MSNDLFSTNSKFSMNSASSQKSKASYNSYFLNKIKGTQDFAYGGIMKDECNKDRQQKLDTIMEKFNKDDEKHKRMMMENKLRRK